MHLKWYFGIKRRNDNNKILMLFFDVLETNRRCWCERPTSIDIKRVNEKIINILELWLMRIINQMDINDYECERDKSISEMFE